MILNQRGALFLAFALFLFSFIWLSGCTGLTPQVQAAPWRMEFNFEDACNMDARCMCMMCDHANPIFPFVETSLKGGKCTFDYCNTTNPQNFLDYLNNLLTTKRLHNFMLGQGPSFSDFDQANIYANNSLGMAVKWVYARGGAFPSAPDASKADCLLGHDVIPVYIIYTEGRNISEAGARNIAKLFKGKGPVIISTEPNFKTSQAAQVARQAYAMKEECPNCMIALTPPDLGLSQYAASDEENGALALAAAWAELESIAGGPDGAKATVDLIGQGALGNEYPYCNPSGVLFEKMKWGREVLKIYGKPTVWLYAGASVGKNKAGTCEWSPADVAAFYDQIIVFSPDLARSGIIGAAPYKMNDGEDPIICAQGGCSYGLRTSLYAQRQPQFNAWFGGAQTFYSEKQQPPVIFPEFGSGSCNYMQVLDALGGEKIAFGSEQSYPTQPITPSTALFTCDACAGSMGAIPPEFRGATQDYDEFVCSEYPEIDNCASAYDVDAILARAIAKKESDLDACRMECGTCSWGRNIDPKQWGCPNTPACAGSQKACWFGLMSATDYPGSPAQFGGSEFNPFDAYQGACWGASRLSASRNRANSLVSQYSSKLGDANHQNWAKVFLTASIYNYGESAVTSAMAEYSAQYSEPVSGNCEGNKNVVSYFANCKSMGYGKEIMTVYQSLIESCPNPCTAAGGSNIPSTCPYTQQFSGIAFSPIAGTDKGYCSDPICDFRGNHWHGGIDIAVPVGTDLAASIAGTVTAAGDCGAGYGNCIEITDSTGRKAFYGHLKCDGVLVSVGDSVSAGQVIGKSGGAVIGAGADQCAGSSTGAHLHFELWNNKDDRDSRTDPNQALGNTYTCPAPDPAPSS